MFGSHSIKSWSTKQQVIELLWGEAEYYSMVRLGSLGMGVSAIAKAMSVSLIRVKTDAIAAKKIASRRGLGKVRH